MKLSRGRMNQLIMQGWKQIREEQPEVLITAQSVMDSESMEDQRFLLEKRKFGGSALWTQVAAVLVFGLIFLFTLTVYGQSESAFSFTQNELNQMKIQLIPDDFKELKL
jgi:hypothetical protein